MAQDLDDFREGRVSTIAIQYPAGTDITGYKAHFALKEELTDTAAVLSATSTAGDHDLDDPTEGLMYIAIDASVDPGAYFYELAVEDADGVMETLIPPAARFRDKLRVLPAVASKDTPA